MPPAEISNLTGTAVGDCIWLPYTGKSLAEIIRLAAGLGWTYRAEPHGLGSLLTCTACPNSEDAP